MERYDSTTYGERIASIYDQCHPDCDPSMVDRLAELAGAGPALELGIGTGRVALPLRRLGVDVRGIDASPAMVERMRAKPGGGDVAVTIGDFAEVDAEVDFSLIYVVFTTFFALLTQDDQVRCMQNVARRLKPGGRFVIEVFVPDLARFREGQAVVTRRVEEDLVLLDASRCDPVTQQVTSQHVYLSAAGVQLYPVKLRFAYPSELDLMARLAGLRLRERWGDWSGEPFTAQSQKHVSAYEKPISE